MFVKFYPSILFTPTTINATVQAIETHPSLQFEVMKVKTIGLTSDAGGGHR
jgi:hypothetical protein